VDVVIGPYGSRTDNFGALGAGFDVCEENSSIWFRGARGLIAQRHLAQVRLVLLVAQQICRGVYGEDGGGPPPLNEHRNGDGLINKCDLSSYKKQFTALHSTRCSDSVDLEGIEIHEKFRGPHGGDHRRRGVAAKVILPKMAWFALDWMK